MAEVSASILTVEKDNATQMFYDLEVAKINYFHMNILI